ncbi:MAG: prepilin peptidase [Bdellovibrionota bacterium]
MPIFYLVVFLFGACFGSFGNVLIYRMPTGEKITGRSHCKECGKTVAWFHNIPMLSYFLLKGQCANCKAKFSIRYPLVEFLIALLWLVVFHLYGVSWLTLEYFILVFGLVVGSFIDLDHMILPDEITLGGCALALIGAAINPEREFMESFLGFLFGGGVLWLVAYVYYVFTGREGLGGGDIKLLAWIGALLGWRAIPFVILSSSVFGSIIGLYVSRHSEDKLKAVIPFGPFIALGAILYILGLKSVGNWYIDLFFPQF